MVKLIVKPADQTAHLTACLRISGQQTRLWKTFLKIFADGGRFRIDLPANFKHRAFASRIAAQKIRIPFPIALLNQLHFDFLFCQAQAHFTAERR